MKREPKKQINEKKNLDKHEKSVFFFAGHQAGRLTVAWCWGGAVVPFSQQVVLLFVFSSLFLSRVVVSPPFFLSSRGRGRAGQPQLHVGRRRTANPKTKEKGQPQPSFDGGAASHASFWVVLLFPSLFQCVMQLFSSSSSFGRAAVPLSPASFPRGVGVGFFRVAFFLRVGLAYLLDNS